MRHLRTSIRHVDTDFQQLSIWYFERSLARSLETLTYRQENDGLGKRSVLGGGESEYHAFLGGIDADRNDQILCGKRLTWITDPQIP